MVIQMKSLKSPPGTLAQALSDSTTDMRLEVLRAIARGHSISMAGRALGISYKAAWQAIDTLSNLSGQVLVNRTVGGSGGGGASITSEGLKLLEMADALSLARQKVMESFGLAGQTGVSLGLRTSMRNQMRCEVLNCRISDTDEYTVLVDLQTQGGQLLQSSVTRESADLLGVQAGASLLVLCKATAVQVVPSADTTKAVAVASTARVSGGVADNALLGKVERRSAGKERDEIVLKLEGADRWVGFAPHSMALRVGQKAVAHMAASALVLAIDA